MISTKEYFVLQILFLVYVLHMGYALQCKTCGRNDPACLLGRDVEIRDCASDNDLCYSWFDRFGSRVGAQRGCISPDTAEYRMIRKLIGNQDSDCVKRVNGLDCFKFCALDKCN